MITKGQVSQYGARLPLAHFFAARKGIHPRIFQKFIFSTQHRRFFLEKSIQLNHFVYICNKFQDQCNHWQVKAMVVLGLFLISSLQFYAVVITFG